MSKTLSFYNLTGGLNTVQDLATINSTPNRTESPDMLNIEYYKLGGIQTMKGNKEVGSSSDFSALGYKDIICGIEYVVGNNSYMLVADKEGYIYEYNKATKSFDELSVKFSEVYNDPEDATSGLDEDFYANVRIYAVAYNNGIVFVNGNEALFYNKVHSELNNVWTPTLEIDDNGTTVSTTFHPTCVASYRGRLFFGADKTEQGNGTYEGGMLFYSGVGLGTEEVWEESANIGEDAGAFAEFFEDSSNFTGLGTWANYLVIHKEQNTYLLDGTGDLASEWELKPYSEYTVPSQQSYVIANNGYYSYIPEAGGIHSLLTRNIYNSTYQGGDIAIKIKDSFEFLDTLNYSKIFAVFHPKKKYIMFYMPMLTGNGSNNCFIYDINTKSWLHRRVPQNVTCAFRYNNDIYIGVVDRETNTVKVLKEFYGKDFDGVPIDFYYLTPPFIWGGGTNKTTTKEFRVKLVNSGANHFYIESFNDGVTDTREQRLTKNINDNLNGLIWDIGLSKDDKLYSDAYETATFYSYTINGETYYADVDNTHLRDDTRIYGAIEAVDVGGNTRYILKNFINFYKYFRVNTLYPGTSSDKDVTKVKTHTSYAWVEQIKGQYCYRSSDGKYYAWVDQTTGLCTTNLEYKDWVQWYGIKLGNQRFRVSETILNSINSKLNKSAKEWKMTSYPDDIRYYVQTQSAWKSNSWNEAGQTWFAALYTMIKYGEYVDDGLNNSLYMNGSMIQRNQTNSWKSKDKIPNSAWKDNPDTVYGKKKNNEVPKGTKPLSITKGTKSTGEQASITISVKIKGTSTTITLNRYSSGDLGQRTSTTNYYTEGDVVGLGIKVYSDSSCKTRYPNSTTTGIISGGTGGIGDTLTINGLTLTKYSQGNGIWEEVFYYKYTDLSTVTPSPIDGAVLIYEYPADDDIIWEQTLTDSIWDYTDKDDKTEYYIIERPGSGVIEGIRNGYTYEDMSLAHTSRGDAWLHPGYLTKRMLLPNQYFETVQFKFSGGGYDKDGNERYNDNICIGGFEVDGIQLAETPWK